MRDTRNETKTNGTADPDARYRMQYQAASGERRTLFFRTQKAAIDRAWEIRFYLPPIGAIDIIHVATGDMIWTV